MSGYYDGEMDAYYGFGKSSNDYEYRRGYDNTIQRLEEEEHYKQAMKEYERQYYAEQEKQYIEDAIYEEYLKAKPRDCQP